LFKNKHKTLKNPDGWNAHFGFSEEVVIQFRETLDLPIHYLLTFLYICKCNPTARIRDDFLDKTYKTDEKYFWHTISAIENLAWDVKVEYQEILVVDTTYVNIQRPPSDIQQNYYNGYYGHHGVKFINFINHWGIIVETEGPFCGTIDDLDLLVHSRPFISRTDLVFFWRQKIFNFKIWT